MLTFEAVTPEEMGLSSRIFLNFIQRLEEKRVPMHSFQFLYHDKLIAEGYYAPYQKATPHRMFSVSKSVVALSIGLLEKEGRLSLSDPIVRYFPDKLPPRVHPWIQEMTIRDMLMMRTCHASTTYKLDMSGDWVASFFTTTPTHPAGTVFHYDTSSAHVLCALVERITGQPIWDYFREKLKALGLSQSSYFLKDPFGVSLGGSGLVCTPEDLLKIAYFTEQKGELNGISYLNSDYMEAAVSNLTPTLVTAPLPSEACGYGYQIWQNQHGGYTFYGMGGQLVIFLPALHLICITTADTQGMAGGNQLIYDALYEEVTPYLPESPAFKTTTSDSDPSQLQERLASLELKPLESTGPLLPLPTGSWDFLENPHAFTGMTLAADSPDCGRLTLYQKDFSWPLSFGYGHMETGRFPKYDQRYAASAAWLDEETLYLRFHIIDDYVGSVHIQLHFNGSRVTLFLKKQEESLFGEFRGHLVGQATS